MTITVFSIVLLAAMCHATWNALVKGGGDKLLTTVLITGSAAAIALVVLPFLPAPARASWPFMASSALCSILYFTLVARIYRVADMSATYPLMRGTAPLIVALASASVLGEPLAPLAWLGIATICAGILNMAIGKRGGAANAGMALALFNALVIAIYTLIDGSGVRRSGSPAAYTLWIFLLTGVPLVAWALVAKGPAFRRYVGRNWHYGMAGGLGTVVSYGLALWAMLVAHVAMVAALRETAILFGAAISGVVLKEPLGSARIAGACIIAAGAAALRLG